MNLLQSLIYGLISGVSEFMPISSLGHQSVLRILFGASQWDPVMDLFVHVALCMTALFVFRGNIEGYVREMGMRQRRGRKRRSYADPRRTYEIRLLITAGVVMLAVLLFTAIARSLEAKPLFTCLFFILNGIMLFIPDYVRQTNKDARMLSGFDGLLIGAASGLRIFSGVSGVGMGLSVALLRGADKKQALNWALMLCIPALLMMCFFDIIGIFTVAGLSVTFIGFLGYLFAAIGAAVGGFAILFFVRFLIAHTGFGGYACYCWGMAILTFILYLIS